MRAWLGSILFAVIAVVSIVVYGAVAFVARLFGYRAMYAVVVNWCRLILGLLKWLCGLDFSVRGREHLPGQSSVVLMKHSSAWETIAQVLIFPRQCWVLKQELIWAPILGWAIWLLKPIPIDRKGGRAAVEQIVAQGRARLDEGLWVVVFPEGTRVPAGQTKRYGLSGTLLAQATGRPVIPVAHNAGFFWPRRSLRKRAGRIDVVIGEPIPTDGRDPREINAEVQAWIERELAGMPTT
jgi:1-acyl-sn-glycerol-3-phosphate acyltransferase